MIALRAALMPVTEYKRGWMDGSGEVTRSNMWNKRGTWGGQQTEDWTTSSVAYLDPPVGVSNGLPHTTYRGVLHMLFLICSLHPILCSGPLVRRCLRLHCVNKGQNEFRLPSASPAPRCVSSAKQHNKMAKGTNGASKSLQNRTVWPS